jgi:hypothetical protein
MAQWLEQEMAPRWIAAVAVGRVVALLPVLLGNPITTLPILVRVALERQEQQTAETVEMEVRFPPALSTISLPWELGWMAYIPMAGLAGREPTQEGQPVMVQHLSS